MLDAETTVIGPTDSLDPFVFRDTTLVLRLISAPTGATPSRRDIADWERAIRLARPDIAEVYVGANASAPAAPTLLALARVSESGEPYLEVRRILQGPGSARTAQRGRR
jgi:hypothetical protein